MIGILHASALDLDVSFFKDFDVLITDPPYSDHVHENCASAGTAGRGALARDLGFDALSDDLRARIGMAAASVRRWSCIFSDFEGTHRWRKACRPAEYIRLVPWVRWSQPQLSGDRPCTGAEAVNIFHAQTVGARGGLKPLPKHWNGPGSLTHFYRRCLRGADKHPTEKPIDLLLDLVSWFSDPGESVLDLCGGSGSTALACRLLGRDCVSVEQSDEWATRARRRVTGPLSPRDRVRAEEWCTSVSAEAAGVPVPTAADGSDVKTFERAARRIADVEHVRGAR